jgi:AcrR family transcriptional regulator
MLHYYFESKEDILLSFIDGIIDHQRAMFSERLRKLQKEHLPYGELIRQVFAFINEEITTDKNLQKVFFEIWAVALYNKEVNTRLKKIYREWIDELGTIMKSGARSSPDSAHLAMAAVAFQEGIGIFSVFFNFNRKYTRMLLEEFQERIIEML